jgi:hypothetical protein
LTTEFSKHRCDRVAYVEAADVADQGKKRHKVDRIESVPVHSALLVTHHQRNRV